jgi:hypothetical protein
MTTDEKLAKIAVVADEWRNDGDFRRAYHELQRVLREPTTQAPRPSGVVDVDFRNVPGSTFLSERVLTISALTLETLVARLGGRVVWGGK